MGKSPPLAVRLAQALPFRRAEGIEELTCLPMLSLQRKGGHHACLVQEWRFIPRDAATSELCGNIQEMAVRGLEGLQALSPRRWPLWGPSSNHPLCGWSMIWLQVLPIVSPS